MTVAASDTSADLPTPSLPVPRRNWFRSWGLPTLAIVVCVTAIAGLQWGYDDPLLGRGIPNLISLSLGLLLLLILFGWFCFLSYYSRRTVLLIALPLVLVTTGWAASIRMVKFNGDMVPHLVYRWEKPATLQQAPETPLAREEREFELQRGDVPAFRGENRDGIVHGPVLNADWQSSPPPELWRTSVGGGYSSIIVVGDSLITLEQRDQNEAITCYRASSGTLQWIYEYPARFYEAMGGLGPRATPTFDQGLVFTMGAQGDVSCLDFFTGKKLWHRNLLQELQIPNLTWGMSSSPLILGDLVIVNPGGPAGNGLMALDRSTGKTVWQGAGVKQYGSEAGNVNHAGYSSPMLLTVAGMEQIVIFDGAGLSGHDPATGTQLWHSPHKNEAGVNVAQPILLESGTDLFISASYGMGSALVEVRQGENPSNWQATVRWHNPQLLRSKFSNPVYYQGHIYGLDEGILMCIDPLNETKKWKKGRYQHGQVLLNGDQLLIMAEDGDLVLVRANPDQFEELTRMPVLPGSRVWNPPTLAHGIVYVRDEQQMAAYDLRKNTGTEPLVPSP